MNHDRQPMTATMIRSALRSEFVGALSGAVMGFAIACMLIGAIRFAELLWLYEGLPPSLESLVADRVVTHSLRGTSHYSLSTWLMMSVLGPLAILGLFGAEAFKARKRAQRVARVIGGAPPERAQLLVEGTEKNSQGKTELIAKLELPNADVTEASFVLAGTRPPDAGSIHVWRDGTALVLATDSVVLEGRVRNPAS